MTRSLDQQPPTPSLRQSVAQQREALERMLSEPLARLAQRCAAAWPDREGLDAALTSGLEELAYAKFLYAVTTGGIQVSDNISHEGRMPEHFGRDRSRRPYMSQVVPGRDFVLSEAYISLHAQRPSVTALHIIRKEGEVVGFVGVDFDLRNLPLSGQLYAEPHHWQQIKGDPAIRSQVFHQCRVESALDRQIDEVMAVLEELIHDHGIFHVKVHFSSNRATVWSMDDPYRYRLLPMEALTDPDVCLAYPRRDYPADAQVPAGAIRPILASFKALRAMDETFYLRSATVNIFNGMVSLTFSCDGSHYMRYDELLDKDVGFWTGAVG